MAIYSHINEQEAIEETRPINTIAAPEQIPVFSTIQAAQGYQPTVRPAYSSGYSTYQGLAFLPGLDMSAGIPPGRYAFVFGYLFEAFLPEFSTPKSVEVGNFRATIESYSVDKEKQELTFIVNLERIAEGVTGAPGQSIAPIVAGVGVIALAILGVAGLTIALLSLKEVKAILGTAAGGTVAVGAVIIVLLILYLVIRYKK